MLLGQQLYTENLTMRNMQDLMNIRRNFIHQMYIDVVNSIAPNTFDKLDLSSSYKDTIEGTEIERKHTEGINEHEIRTIKDAE